MFGYVDFLKMGNHSCFFREGRERGEEIQLMTLHNTTQTEIPIFSLIIMNSYL